MRRLRPMSLWMAGLMCTAVVAIAQSSGGTQPADSQSPSAAPSQNQVTPQQPAQPGELEHELPPAPPPPPLTTAAVRNFTPMPADPEIAAALQEISPQQVRATIEKLVSFNRAEQRYCGGARLDQERV